MEFDPRLPEQSAARAHVNMRTSWEPVRVYTVDEHNEAFYCWYEAMSEGCFVGPLDLLHVDAHDDMGRPRSFRKSIYCADDPAIDRLEYYKDFAARQLHIGDFVIPAVLVGLVKNVYFVYPKWRKLQPRRKRYNVSTIFGEGKRLKYGKQAADNMEERFGKALPDLRHYSFLTMDIDRIPQKRRVILDIDMDYFACRDSILNHHSYELEITALQFQARADFLADKTIPYAELDFGFVERDGKYFAQIAHKKGIDVSHLPPEEEIVEEIRRLMKALRDKQIRPAVVTIARSSISGYCPSDYTRLVETELHRELRRFLDC